jgi:hypothetical protein
MSDALQVEDAAAEALMGEIVDDFLARLGRGERPDAEEYARAHPQLAVVLRQMPTRSAAVYTKGDAGRREGAGPARRFSLRYHPRPRTVSPA